MTMMRCLLYEYTLFKEGGHTDVAVLTQLPARKIWKVTEKTLCLVQGLCKSDAHHSPYLSSIPPQPICISFSLHV